MNSLPDLINSSRMVTDTTIKSIEPKEQKFKWYLVNPMRRWKKVWNLIIASILIYTALIMPFRLAFYEPVFWDFWTVFDLAIDCLFFLDIIITLLTPYMKKEGNFETRIRNIAFKYLRSWLILDLTACIPFSLIEFYTGSSTDTSNTNYNTLLRLARIPRLYKLLRLARLAKAFKMFRNSEFLEKVQDTL